MNQYKEYPYSVRIDGVISNGPDDYYWDWCCNTLAIGTWKMMIGIFGARNSYYFLNEEDLLAFKLRFGL